MSLFARIVLGLLIFTTTSDLFACAVCGVAKEESRIAFIVTTGILTFVPLIVIGFVIYYIYRQVKARESEASKNLPA
jgi:hypothetical protein